MANNKYPATTIATAYHLYLDSEMTIAAIGEHIGVPEQTVKYWIRTKGWAAKKKELTSELVANVDAERQLLISKNVVKTAKRHIDASEVIEEEIIDMVKRNTKNLKPREISDLAKALSQSSGVSARVTGLDKSSSIDTPSGTNVSMGSGSVLNIGIQPLSDKESAQYEEDAIDITDDVHEPYTDFPD